MAIAASSLVKGTFLQRLNRFAARVEVEGTCHLVHVPTSGRLRELLVPGAEVRLLPARHHHRRTRYTLVLVRTGEDAVQSGPNLEGGGQGSSAPPVWVDLRAAQANALFLQALRQGFWPELVGLGFQRREVSYAHSRLDFALGPAGEPAFKNRPGCLVEVKSVTLVKAGRGLFPDAPTERGTRHLAALREAKAEGLRAAVVFAVQRPDALLVSPYDATDSRFGRALREAARAGVELYAFSCQVTEAKTVPVRPLPVVLP